MHSYFMPVIADSIRKNLTKLRIERNIKLINGRGFKDFEHQS